MLRQWIPEYWLINLPKGLVEVYSEPAAGTYQQIRQAKHGEILPVPGVPGISLAVSEIFG